ncbi:hypothetical protein BST61_g3801 [Cercospora zeina]
MPCLGYCKAAHNIGFPAERSYIKPKHTMNLKLTSLTFAALLSVATAAPTPDLNTISSRQISAPMVKRQSNCPGGQGKEYCKNTVAFQVCRGPGQPYDPNCVRQFQAKCDAEC